MAGRTLLFLHGIGQDDRALSWLAALDDGFRRAGVETLAERGYEISAPSYLDLLENDAPTDDHEPTFTYRRLGDPLDESELIGSYWRRLSALERTLHELHAAKPWLDQLPVDAAAHLLMSRVAAQAHGFRRSPERRHAIYERLLQSLPRSGRVTVIAHSLGSVVAADLLYHLPPGLTVDLVVTLGSPLSLNALRRHLQRLSTDFPFGIVGAWLNVIGHLDPVTGFRGVSAHFPEALDVFVDNGSVQDAHSAQRYLQQEVGSAGPAMGGRTCRRSRS